MVICVKTHEKTLPESEKPLDANIYSLKVTKTPFNQKIELKERDPIFASNANTE